MADERADFLARYSNAVAELTRRGEAARWNLPAELLSDAIYASVRAWAGDDLSLSDQDRTQAYLDSLNAQDLVLACACRAGNGDAWAEFIARYRPKLYQAAWTLTRDQVKADEMADSLYADLYGLEDRNGARRSLLAYFHGRSSLQTWLRAVLAQRFVDSHRSEHRTETLADIELRDPAIDPSQLSDPKRTSYVEALSQALALAVQGLRPRDRLRLSFYYVEELTLKEIGRLMSEHESTVSRRLSRTRLALRKQVGRTLRRQMHYSEDQIRLCYDYAIEDGLNVGQFLQPANRADTTMTGKNIPVTRSNSRQP